MKKLFIVLFFSFAFLTTAQAQKGTTTISISYGDGKGQIKPLMAKVEMSGRFDEGPVRSFDMSLAGMVSKHAAVEIGVSVLNHRYLFTKYDYPGPQQPETKVANTIIFPVKLRVDILKYLFISGGFLLNAELGKGHPVDLGFGIGAGIQYYFKNKYGVFVYPQTNIHTIAIGLLENHIAFGLSYRIPKK